MATNALNGKPLTDGVLMAGVIGLVGNVGMGAAVKLGGKALGRIAGRSGKWWVKTAWEIGLLSGANERAACVYCLKVASCIGSVR